MINCPICNVPNDPSVKFCTECGQRLGNELFTAPAATTPTPAKPGPSRAKLHSPLLDDAVEENMPPYMEGIAPPSGRGDLNRLRQMSQRGGTISGTQPAAPARSAEPNYPTGSENRKEKKVTPAFPADSPPPAQPRRHLHSPLLGDPEEEYPDYEPVTQGKGHLHSPLLGGSNNAPSGGKKHLHSPLLDNDEDPYEDSFNYPGLPTTRKGLHSPLLGGENEDLHYPPAAPASGVRPSGLRSPILQGRDPAALSEYYDDEDYDPYADEDNPSVLRSPLLGAKTHHREPASVPDEPAPPTRGLPRPPAGAVPPAKNLAGKAPASPSPSGRPANISAPANKSALPLSGSALGSSLPGGTGANAPDSRSQYRQGADKANVTASAESQSLNQQLPPMIRKPSHEQQEIPVDAEGFPDMSALRKEQMAVPAATTAPVAVSPEEPWSDAGNNAPAPDPFSYANAPPAMPGNAPLAVVPPVPAPPGFSGIAPDEPAKPETRPEGKARARRSASRLLADDQEQNFDQAPDYQATAGKSDKSTDGSAHTLTSRAATSPFLLILGMAAFVLMLAKTSIVFFGYGLAQLMQQPVVLLDQLIAIGSLFIMGAICLLSARK